MKILSKALLAGTSAGLVALASASPAMAQDSRWYGDRDGADYGYGYGYGNAGGARDAVRKCTVVAERQASRFGRADVTQIRNVDRNWRGFTVSGRIAVNDRWDHDRRDFGYGRDEWRGNDWRRGDSGWFRCRVEFGRVVDLDLNGLRR